MNTFGDFLYTLRKEKGMTQAELAERLGVTNKAVSKWETGEAMPETGLLLPISRIFDVSVDELLDGKLKDGSENESAEYGDYSEDSIKQHLFTRGKDDASKTLLEKIGGAICASVMFLSISTYILIGVLTNFWHPYWVIIPVGALSCGIIGIIFDMCNVEKRNKKLAKGENPYSGGACGIIMLSCIITYLFCGALLNLWHPLWVIIVGGALLCGVVGSIGEIISHKKRK